MMTIIIIDGIAYAAPVTHEITEHTRIERVSEEEFERRYGYTYPGCPTGVGDGDDPDAFARYVMEVEREF